MRKLTFGVAVSLGMLFWSAQSDRAQGASGLVKITPLGTVAGDLCRDDRAMVFEDPTGVRILYDPGRTVDETDSRLGEIDVMLLSHGHVDHVGNTRPNRSAGTCAAPVAGAVNTDTNFAAIASLKNAAVFAPGELDQFINRKISNLRGGATVAGCPAIGLESEVDVPLAAPCTASLRPGGSRTVVRSGTPGLVRLAAVPAFHSNGIDPALVDTPGVPAGYRAYGGEAAGFVISFTNGLVAYLTGDSGMFGDMNTIIQQFYRPNLMVINMSDQVTFGPLEAVFVTKNLVRPATVMPSHVNEAATSGGVVLPGTRVDRFSTLVRDYATVVVPLSEVTRSFDGSGKCVACR